MSYNNNRQNDQLPKVFSRLGRAAPPRQPNYNNNRYYNGQQFKDVGFRIARPHQVSNLQYHYNTNTNMAPNNMNFQPHSTNFYSGYSRPQQEQAQQQRPYFPNNNNNTTINTNGRINTNFRPDASASTPTPPTPPLPAAPSGSTGNKNGFSFVKNAHKDPTASDMIISFVRNDNTGAYTYHNNSDQAQDQAILHSPPSSTVPSPSVSNNSDHVVVDYRSSSRRNDDNDRDEQDYQPAPSHRDIIAKSIQITASRPLGSDKNGISSSSVPHHRDSTATTTTTNNDLHDQQQQTHLSDHHEMNRTVAVNRKVIVEKRDRSRDNTISSSKRSRLSSRSISPSPVRDKRARSLSRESDDYYHRKHSRRVSDSEEDDDDGNSRRRRRRSPSPISPPRRSHYHSRRDSAGSSISSEPRRTSLSPFSGRRKRSLSPGSSSDEDNAPFLRHEPDRYIPDYNRRPLPPQHRRRRVSNDNTTITAPVTSSKPAAVVTKPSPVTKPAPVAAKPAPVAAKPAAVSVKPSTAVVAPPASSLATKNVSVVPAVSSSSSTEKRKDLGSYPPLGTSSTFAAPKQSDTTGNQLRNLLPLGSTSVPIKPAPTTKELRNFPPLGSSAPKPTRPLPIAAPAPKELRSFPLLGHHQSHDLRSYPPLGSNASYTASSPHARSPYPPSPSASPATSSPSRSYNRVWMKPMNDVGANGQQEGSNVVARKQVPPPPPPPPAVIAKPPPPPPSSIANQQIKVNSNNASMMAQVKQEPVSDVPVTKPVPAASSATINAQVNGQAPRSGPVISSPALFNGQAHSSGAAASSPALQNGSTRPPPPPPPSSATIQAQNIVQTNGATAIPTTIADPPAAAVQQPSVTTQQTDANAAASVSTQVTAETPTEGLSKSARKRRARKQRQLEQSRMLAIEERDDVVMDVLPTPQQPPVEEDEQEDATSNANNVIASQTQPQPAVQNMDVNKAATSHENGITVDNSHSTSTIHQVVQSQLLSPPNSMDEPVSEQHHQQETAIDSAPAAAAVVPDVPSPARPARRRRLPSPWKVKMSDSMEIYYHNPITGQDTFIRPE